MKKQNMGQYQPIKKQPEMRDIRNIIFRKATALFVLLILANILCSKKIQYLVAIVGTNDIHGQAFPMVVNLDGRYLQIGGLVYLSTMIKIVREEMGGNMLYLDGGDEYQGGIQASQLVSSGQIINDFFKSAGLNASTIGNHQFDYPLSYLKKQLENKQVTNLAANLLSENGQSQFLPFLKKSQLFTMPNGVKVGVIGLATTETTSTTAGFINKYFPAYQFLPYKQAVVKESAKLKRQGAHIVVILSHVGDSCPSDYSYKVHQSQNYVKQQQNLQSDKQACVKDEISKLIDSLPIGTINGIIQGHRHKQVHRSYKNIPYIGSAKGKYFNILYFKLNSKKQIISSTIEGAIPVCKQIFNKTKNCQYKQDWQSLGALRTWQFHGVPVTADQQLQSVYLKKYTNLMKQYDVPVFETEIFLTRKQNQQCQLANLFTFIIASSANKFKPDFSVLNTGLFRTDWAPGKVTYSQFYNMFPFNNSIVQTFDINGADLIKMFQYVQTGRRFMQVWNIQMDLVGEAKVLNNLRFADGRIIQPDKLYRGVTLDYLLRGGDSFIRVPNLPSLLKNKQNVGQFRNLILPLLKQMKIIKKDSWKDTKGPRVKLVKL